MIQITKIKLGDEITVVYEERDDATASKKSVTLTSKEPPLKIFEDSVAKLIEYVAFYCYLDLQYWEEAKIIGMTFKYNDENDVGVVITAQCNHYLPCVINTPFLNPNVMADNDKLLQLVEEIQQHAISFVRGDRAVKQLNLLEVA